MSRHSLYPGMIRAALLLALVAAPAPDGARAGAEVPYGQGVLWRVERAGAAPSHLFGTMHSNDPEITRLPQPVAAAFEAARSLALEMVLSAEAIAELRAARRLPRGDLRDLIGPARFERVADLAWRHGISVATLRRLKPWAAIDLLSLPPAEVARRAARQPEPPLDLVLQQRAAAHGMAIFGLESAAEQIAIFDDLPIADQIAFLDAALAENPHLSRWWTRLKDAYLARDIGSIYRLVAESSMADDPELMRLFQARVIDQRNRRMVERMASRLAAGHSFIAVGALHLPGEHGILNLLERRGYRIARVY